VVIVAERGSFGPDLLLEREATRRGAIAAMFARHLLENARRAAFEKHRRVDADDGCRRSRELEAFHLIEHRFDATRVAMPRRESRAIDERYFVRVGALCDVRIRHQSAIDFAEQKIRAADLEPTRVERRNSLHRARRELDRVCGCTTLEKNARDSELHVRAAR